MDLVRPLHMAYAAVVTSHIPAHTQPQSVQHCVSKSEQLWNAAGLRTSICLVVRGGGEGGGGGGGGGRYHEGAQMAGVSACSLHCGAACLDISTCLIYDDLTHAAV